MCFRNGYTQQTWTSGTGGHETGRGRRRFLWLCQSQLSAGNHRNLPQSGGCPVTTHVVGQVVPSCPAILHVLKLGTFISSPACPGESWALSQSVCKFRSCPGIDCLALIWFKMLLMNKQRLVDRGAAGASSPSSALSYIPQQGHGSSLEMECVLSNKCDNPRWFLPPQSGEQFVESGPKILHIWDPLHAVSTWKICIIFNLMGEFQLLQLSQCSCSWNVCKQIW